VECRKTATLFVFETPEEIYDALKLFDFFLKIGVQLKNGSESPLFLNLNRVAAERKDPLSIDN